MMRIKTDFVGKPGLLGFALLLALPALQGCPSDDTKDTGEEETSTTGDGDGDGDTGDGDGDGDTGDGDGDGDSAEGDGDGDGDTGLECPTHDPGPGAADGDPCFANEDCASKLCEVFQDVPAVEGTCQPAPDECRTRIMGRTLDFVKREPAAGVDLRVAQAILASVDPVNAAAEASGTSDDVGIIDTVSDGQIAAALGIIGLAEAPGFYLTATGLASPAAGTNYGPANAIHDIWVVPENDLTAWSNLLMTDMELVNDLPLGAAGGVVGWVRDVNTGDPVADAVVVPTSDTSGAKIRYLNTAGDDFTKDGTGVSGIFVILAPGLGETFDVELAGMSQGLSGTAGSASGAIFTLIMNVDI